MTSLWLLLGEKLQGHGKRVGALLDAVRPQPLGASLSCPVKTARTPGRTR